MSLYLRNITWHPSINLNYKFPELLYLNVIITHENQLPQIQSFLDTHDTIIILLISIEIKHFQPNNNANNRPKFVLTLPSNIEILSLSSLKEEATQLLTINYDNCYNKLKYVTIINNTWCLLEPLLEVDSIFSKNKCELQHLTIVNIQDMKKIKDKKLENVKNVYTPSTPSFSKTMIREYIPKWPTINDVKNCLDNKDARLLIRESNVEAKRNWLWCIFWHERSEVDSLLLQVD